MNPRERHLTTEQLEFARSKCLIRIVDDEDALRDALRFVLEMEGWRVADYPTATAFLTGDAPSEPGCVVLDVRMPGMTGIEAQAAMNERGITLPIIFLTGHGDVEMAVSALQDGAADFIQKPIDNERLLKSIAWAAWQSASRAAGLPGEDAAERLSKLTGREREIAKLIAAGMLNREIAERFGNAVRTIEVHRASILRKLGVKTPEEIRALLEHAES
ncbi:response regulator transcription factor [Sutterella sp.]|uniref:response regulator transcription factor n=1 Tax=Sutterella sp. TaxID=1981025 RepID=UPI0026DF75A1|nr:response regulator [Sutterella sp.]MDO5531400.1 response regulator [Sutterella sp.]